MKTYKSILIIVAAIFSLSACKEKEVKKEEVLRPVAYQVVGEGDAQTIRTFSGVAKAGDKIELSFRSGGIISKVYVSKGQKVKKGDLIAKLDNVEANLAYEKSVSALSSAKSALNTAKSSQDRIRSLYEKGSKSLSDYEQARDGYQNALSQFESAKRNKSIQATQLSYGIIKAPKAGLIADTDGGVGESVSTGHQFAILNAGKDLKVEIGLPESVVNKVSQGMKAKITFSSISKTFDATVTEVAPTVDADASTYTTSIVIDKPTSEIKPGMTASVTFDFGNAVAKKDNLLVVPVKAVGEDANGRFVFVVESQDGKTGTVKKQKITIGDITSEGFKVKSGLKAGQKIATAGLQTLLEGQKVKLQ